MIVLPKSIEFNTELAWPEAYLGFSRSTSIETLMAWSAIEKYNWPFQDNKEKIGLYGAFTNGPLYRHEKYNPESHDSYLQSKTNKTIWPPKQHFKQLGPIKLSHISLLLKFKGPMYCATDVNTATIDALTMAQCDLQSNHVDQALVIFGFNNLCSQNHNSKAVGGALLFDQKSVSSIQTFFEIQDNKKTKNYDYGHCSQAVRIFFEVS